MHVTLVLDQLLIHIVGLDTIGTVPAGQHLDKVVLEFGGVVCDVAPGVLTDDKHLPKMSLGLCMTLESVLVSALFLTDLTVPSQTLKTLGLHLVRNELRSTDYIRE